MSARDADGSVESGDRAWWRDVLAIRVTGALVVVLWVNVRLTTYADAARIAPHLQPLSVPPIAAFTAAGVVGAAVVYLGLDRFVDQPNRTFRRVAVGVLLVSFVPDLALFATDPSATTGGVAILLLMHVVVAAVCLWLIPGRGG